MRSKTYWSNKLSVEDIDWNVLFYQNQINPYMPKKCRDFNWKIFHGLANTESKLKHMNYSDGICKICNTGIIKNLEHLLIGCRQNIEFWKLLEKIIKKHFGYNYSTDMKLAMFGVLNFKALSNPNDLLIVNTLLGINRYHIWKVRNCTKYGEENINIYQSLRRLKNEIECHLQVLLFGSKTSSDVKEKIKSIILNLKTDV